MTNKMEDSISNAEAMIGWGEAPAVTIEPPKRTIQRRGKKMVEVEEPAYVKFSTNFKNEIADLDVYALKVFLYIGLSISFETGTAWPGVRKIAAETGMNKSTVIKAIEELETKLFLKVWRRDGESNIYKPDCYFAIGESVPRNRTVDEGLSGENTELSGENVKLSGGGRVNHAQQDNKTQPEIDLSIENQIFLGKIKVQHSKADQIKNALREYFKLTPRWTSRFDKDWLEWALSENMTPEQVKAASERWGKDRRFNWTHPNLKLIADYWLMLIEDAVQSVQLDGSALERYA